MLLPITNNQSGFTGAEPEVAVPFDSFVKTISSKITQIPIYSELILPPELSDIQTDYSVNTPTSQILAQNLTENVYCSSPNFIEQQIPFWIVQKYSNSEESYLISFLKEYYNWLYCGFKKAEIQITPYDLPNIIDIDQIPESFLDYYIQTYAPFIETNSQLIQKQNLRNFIKNIKTKFLAAKGTKASYEYLLKTLFGITLESISYAKPLIQRLNGGRFENLQPKDAISRPVGQFFDSDNRDPASVIWWDNYGELQGITSLKSYVVYNSADPNLVGSGSILQDGDFFHDYSYLIITSADVQDVELYSNTILRGLHPAGYKAFFEQYIPVTPIDFGSIDDNTDSVTPVPVTYELPVIKNYLLYYPTYNFNTAGLTFCDCCNSDCDPTSATSFFPLHANPRWSETILDGITSFKDITIGSFIKLEPAELSPNPDIDDCSSCGG